MCAGDISCLPQSCVPDLVNVYRGQRQHICEMGLPWVNVRREHIMLTCSAMCSGPCQCIHRPQQQHIGDVGEMGLPWMNVFRGHIMLTLAKCSGTLGSPWVGSITKD
jgi:hypothetical protein